MESLLVDLFGAYFSFRKGKRNKQENIGFEMNFESEIIKLYEELITKIYKSSTSTYFVITDTVKKEIFAAHIRNRVAHNLPYSYLYSLYDPLFINDTREVNSL